MAYRFDAELSTTRKSEPSMQQDISAILEERPGRVRARQRLGIEMDYEQRVFESIFLGRFRSERPVVTKTERFKTDQGPRGAAQVVGFRPAQAPSFLFGPFFEPVHQFFFA